VSAPRFLVGIDVGSTTVKAVAVDADSDAMVWSDYQRHETRQPEKTLDFLTRLEADLGIGAGNCRVFFTGSGGGALAPLVGGAFVQEVTAVSLAVEKLHPEVNSIIELGGQDAKIIVFQQDAETGRKRKIPSMNDKCAGGTGAVIDKINAKLRIPPDRLCEQGYLGIKLHKVAGKCGVFAETDINGLQKAGTPPDELMASLFEAIILQNLTVLTRGHTLRPHVLLLGGPNTFIRGMREAWQHNIPKIWQERGIQIPPGESPETLIRVPQHAQYFAAIGAVQFGRDEEARVGRYEGTAALARSIGAGRAAEKSVNGTRGLSGSEDELRAFKDAYTPAPFVPPALRPGDVVRGFVGVDGGSTSTKAVLLSAGGDVLRKVYQLSKGNPIQDTVDMFERLRAQVECDGATLEVLGVGTTGYAKDILKDALQADAALVETVAHTESALRFAADPHVIVDVGGQDIKLIVLKEGRVKDFKLNTQCSAGNGYFLQSTAEAFGIPLHEFADHAFAADAMPTFGYGCAVFMQSDIVNFQRQGWAPREILAGLAAVLPKNIFLYVASIPNLAQLGSRFVLQGGTQHNLAAVKAQVDFIRSSFRGTDIAPEIVVHEHCGEAGAIGAAVEAMRLYDSGRRTTFIGLDAVRTIAYRATRTEATRCTFCKNGCLRTFIDIRVPDAAASPGRPNAAAGAAAVTGAAEAAFVDVSAPAATPTPPALPPPRPAPVRFVSKVPKRDDERRLIIATCEKGAVEDVETMRGIKSAIDEVKKANPNFVELAAAEAFRPRRVERVADEMPSRAWTRGTRARVAAMRHRGTLRIGIPRVLNMYTYAPFFSGYFGSLGVPAGHLVYSDVTTPDLYREGGGRGSIDPCFPSKISVAHVHNLLFVKHAKQKLDFIFFPMVDVLHTSLTHLRGSNACPTVTVSPETAKAAFTKEGDVFARHDVTYLNPVLDFADRSMLATQLLEAWGAVLGLSEAENRRAVDAGFGELLAFEADLQRRARAALDRLERENRLGIVVLARPYHHDPGLNHQVLEEFQKLGYPVFSQSLLPMDPDLLDRLFGADVRSGSIRDPLEIQDVWKHSYSANTNQKVWAAKFTARHPNLVALELSSFKCGHDAPTYSVVESIVERSGTPYFSFKDIDENRPSGSIRIRVETIHYFLKRWVDDRRKPPSDADVDRHIAEFERRLRRGLRLEAELAALGTEHRRLADEMRAARTLLPVLQEGRTRAPRDGRMNGEPGCSA
jgi:activator of 2-hydroxyglutaryl-CoA dehydratase/predicted nucleotide-binding protein (sugar kinase/HSP70/actin superfamily)